MLTSNFHLFASSFWHHAYHTKCQCWGASKTPFFVSMFLLTLSLSVGVGRSVEWDDEFQGECWGRITTGSCATWAHVFFNISNRFFSFYCYYFSLASFQKLLFPLGSLYSFEFISLCCPLFSTCRVPVFIPFPSFVFTEVCESAFVVAYFLSFYFSFLLFWSLTIYQTRLIS